MALARLLAMMVLAAVSTDVLADGLGPVFHRLGAADGLPDNRVEAVVQDQFGYVWIGTQGGLVRHDGTRIEVIGADPDRPDPLPGRNIMALHAHSSGTVWAAVADQGVIEIGPDLRQRRHLAPRDAGGPLDYGHIWSIAEDCDGGIWLAFMLGGVARYDPVTEDYRFYGQQSDSGLSPNGFQLKLLTDSACRVWLLQTGQLSLYSPDQDRFRSIVGRDDGAVLMSLGEVEGHIYYSQGTELHSLGPVAGADAAEPAVVLTAERTISGLAGADPDGHMLVVSYSGLYRWHPQQGLSRHTGHVDGLPSGLPSEQLHAIMIDREGGAWIAVQRQGLVYLPPDYAAFERYQRVPGHDTSLSTGTIAALAADADARLWLAGPTGRIDRLSLINGKIEALEQVYPGASFKSTGSVVDLVVDDDALYVVSLASVHRYRQGEAGDAVLMQRRQIDEGTFHFLRPDADGWLWVGTRDVGLLRLHPETGRRQHFRPHAEGRFRLAETAPVELVRGPDNRWWLAGQQTVYRYDAQTGFAPTWQVDRPPLKQLVWSGNRLWVATESGLELLRLDGQQLEPVRTFPFERSLGPGQVLALYPDGQDQLWLVRANGLVRLDVPGAQFRSYTSDDGLPFSDFLPAASTRLDDGRLALGGSRGLVLFDPARLHRRNSTAPVYITALQSGARHFDLAPGPSPAIELTHDQNSFSVDYHGVSFSAAGRLRYRVRLAGWDNEWSEPLSQTRRYYSRLRPGRYRFEVRLDGPTDAGAHATDAVDIYIASPPWLSPWAILAYVLTGVTGMGFGWHGLRKTQRRRRELREARQKRRLAESQSRVVARLNASLESRELAATIGREMLMVTGGRRAIVGFTHPLLPEELICAGELDADARPKRDDWLRRCANTDGITAMVVTLEADCEAIARVLIEAGAGGFAPDHGERLDLLTRVCGQALHNALLLERVRKLAVEARQASSAKSEFLATMSHEIRTPLHGVLGMVDLLCENRSEVDRQQLLDTLRQSGQQLQRIIDDVLDLSRIEAGRLSLEPACFDLVAMLEHVVDLHAANAARKGLDLRLRMASDLPPVACGDADRIAQILGNLLSNAVKFTPLGGVELSAEQGQDGQLVVVVSDSGPGIDACDRARLFEPFTQLDAVKTRSHSGSGLGLAICRRLVDAMGGSLELLASQLPGSRFMMRLPVLDAASIPLPLTGLLADMILAARVQAPTWRVLRRLARRWGVKLVRPGSNQYSSWDVVLVDARVLVDDDGAELEAWRERAGTLAWLQSPFQHASGQPPPPPDCCYLRWPLVESRLAGLLLDLRMGRVASQGDH